MLRCIMDLSSKSGIYQKGEAMHTEKYFSYTGFSAKCLYCGFALEGGFKPCRQCGD
ncbi:MAG: hypothetical protein ACOYIT_06945 [Christensenellales bacterium]